MTFDDDVYSYVIIRDGKIVDEYFKEGYGRTSVFTLQSCSKSITSALVGIAIYTSWHQGNVDSDFLPIKKAVGRFSSDRPFFMIGT